MLNILVGHRGTGKSHYLNLLSSFYRDNSLKALFFDLDEEVEKSEGQSLESLFQKGEKYFRQCEKKMFQNLIQSIPKDSLCFLSVGAGFVFEKDPSWNIIYLSRPSDKEGRVFFDRPGLTSSESPFEEYKMLYKKRNAYYLKQADEQLFRREHFKDLEDSDMLFFGLKALSQPYFSFRLNPEELPKEEKKIQLYLKKRQNWGIRFFELHDKTADEKFVQTVRSFIPEDKILFSSQCSKIFNLIENKKHWSWDLKLGSPPEAVSILSLHERGKKKLKNVLKDFSSYKNYHLKLAVEIFNLKELKMAYDWYLEDPKNRSFLPRSKDGRWLWFRQAFGPKMFLHFIKEWSDGNEALAKNFSYIPDQPFLSEALPFIQEWKFLAGILGNPVQLSATPAEQNDFFYKERNIPVLSLPLLEKEMTKESLGIFSELGFVFFAVTSPLKNKAFLSADQWDKISQELKTANTLIFNDKIWRAFNTDKEGLKVLESYSFKDTVVWGGGGIRPVLQKILPLAQFYSVRTGKLLEDNKQKFVLSRKLLEGFWNFFSNLFSFFKRNKLKSCDFNSFKSDKLEKSDFSSQIKTNQPITMEKKDRSLFPKTLIWAVGRKRMERKFYPPKHFQPLKVIDINYTEDSPGREFALQVQSEYQNGWEFFQRQAKKQRELFLLTRETRDIIKSY